jgi:GT2 family glycosyltransferase
MPQVAIIILNWNGLEDTLECLESVLKNDYPNYSVYLIDNASTKDELASLKKHYTQAHKIHFIQNTANLGFAEGNNVGIRKALANGAKYIFTLNNDTVVDRDFLMKAVEAAQASEAGIVATTMVNYYHRNKLDNTGHLLLSNGDTIPRDRNQSLSHVKGHPSNVPPFGACAGAALYSAQMLKEIGLFDADFFLNYEDSDLSLRAIVRGWEVASCPSSIIYHKLNASIGKIKNTDYRIRSQRNQIWAYMHNTPLPVFIANLPWIILRGLLVMIISIITFRWTISKIFILSRIAYLRSLPLVLKKRHRVLKYQRISSWQYWAQQTSWFSTYWKYFQDIVIKRKDSVMR